MYRQRWGENEIAMTGICVMPVMAPSRGRGFFTPHGKYSTEGTSHLAVPSVLYLSNRHLESHKHRLRG